LAQSKGGTLRIALPSTVDQLDPAKANVGPDYIYTNLVFNGLTRMTEELKVVPDLATSWQNSDDLKTWTFRLHEGVKFHNGQEMVADDVVATLQRLLDPATGARSRTNLMLIEKITAPDRATVVFQLAFPYSTFADLLSDRQLKIIPRDAIGQVSTNPVGTGPFAVASYVPGDRLLLKRHEGYFEQGMPLLDRVELRSIPETSVQIAALQSGDVDVVFDLLPETVKALVGQKGVRVETVATGTWDAAMMNNAAPPFNDPRIRRAFHLAVDKRDVVDVALFGQGTPTHSPIPANHPFFASNIPIAQADPEAARQLLAEAGHPQGIRIPIIVPSDQPAYERLGVTLQQLVTPGGFTLDVQRVPYLRFSAEFAGKAPLLIDGYFSRPTIDTATYPFLHSTGTSNQHSLHYKNPKLDDTLDAARRAVDVSKQRELYVQMQQELVDDPACFFAYTKNFSCAYRPAVQGLKTHPMQWFDLRTAHIAA
jgi:peptide/nickel transport system substrate-binding protein